MTVYSGGSGSPQRVASGTKPGGAGGAGPWLNSGTVPGGAGGGASTGPRVAMVVVPDFADGAVAELRHGPDGTVIADIRIPGPNPAFRHGGPDAGWYTPAVRDGWQRITDTEVSRYPNAMHFMHDPSVMCRCCPICLVSCGARAQP